MLWLMRDCLDGHHTQLSVHSEGDWQGLHCWPLPVHSAVHFCLPACLQVVLTPAGHARRWASAKTRKKLDCTAFSDADSGHSACRLPLQPAGTSWISSWSPWPTSTPLPTTSRCTWPDHMLHLLNPMLPSWTLTSWLDLALEGWLLLCPLVQGLLACRMLASTWPLHAPQQCSASCAPEAYREPLV